MKPLAASESFQRPRKRSLDQVATPAEIRTTIPTTFFLARGLDRDIPVQNEINNSKDELNLNEPKKIEAMTEARDEKNLDTESVPHPINSTILLKHNLPRRRTPSLGSQTDAVHSQPLTPLLFGSSAEGSISSSPKSVSARLIPHGEEESTVDELGSQAIIFSREEEESPSDIRDSAPQLIMPSIKMPSRRPFTTTGKEMGRIKIMVAGGKGLGKTSLIKSIVQACEDIVHVDPIQSPMSSTTIKSSRPKPSNPSNISEIFASTKPYPSWWSDHESSYTQRRKSMGDSVLERNVCFVDTAYQETEPILKYMEEQLYRSSLSNHASRNDLVGLLSGMGGSQVDVVLYLLSKDTIETSLEQVKQLSELCNVIPIIAKSDLLSTQQNSELKKKVQSGMDSISVAIPSLPNSKSEEVPYTISSTNCPDTENMDASLLMSSEYVQPLAPSELSLLVDRLFDRENTAYLRHSSAKLLLSWKARHPATRPSSPSPQLSTSVSPSTLSHPTSGILVPYGANTSLNTSNSFSFAKLADHTQREEQLAHVRLSQWANDLQQSLKRERERYESLARGERAVWLVDKVGEEVKQGSLVPVSRLNASAKCTSPRCGFRSGANAHDPLGLLHWSDTLQNRSFLALQIVGSLGVVGGLTLWLAKLNGLGPWS